MGDDCNCSNHQVKEKLTVLVSKTEAGTVSSYYVLKVHNA